jgi:glycosyltransferase involved in cell wall biosynthesis
MMGGVENHVQQISTRLALAGVRVTIVTCDPDHNLPQRESIEGVEVRRVRSYPKGKDLYFAPGIWRIVLDGKWDIVHCENYLSLVAPLAMIAARRSHVPYVVTFHGGGHSSPLRNRIRGVQRRVLRPLLARAAVLHATAEFEMVQFGDDLSIGRDKFDYAPNGSDLAAVDPATRSRIEGALIVSAGRLERYKGHHRAIAAMPTVLAQRPEARLRIAGRGPFESELRLLARRLGVSHAVEIRASPSSAEFANELPKAAVVVLLSEYETHPMAVLEALAMGRPTIVADTSGLSELAAKGWVTAVPLDAPARQVGEAILDQLRHPLVPVAIDLPTWDDCADELHRAYLRALDRSHQ